MGVAKLTRKLGSQPRQGPAPGGTAVGKSLVVEVVAGRPGRGTTRRSACARGTGSLRAYLAPPPLPLNQPCPRALHVFISPPSSIMQFHFCRSRSVVVETPRLMDNALDFGPPGPADSDLKTVG